MFSPSYDLFGCRHLHINTNNFDRAADEGLSQLLIVHNCAVHTKCSQQKVYIFMLYVTFQISVTRLVSNYGVDDEEGEDDMSISSAEEAEDDELSYSTEKVIMNYHIQQKK